MSYKMVAVTLKLGIIMMCLLGKYASGESQVVTSTPDTDNSSQWSSHSVSIHSENHQHKKLLSQLVCNSSSNVFLCTDEGVLTSYGICVTQVENGSIFNFLCPYYRLKGHTVSVSKPGFIVLPENVSDLNDYMCGPMNRKGLLCKDCIEGFGPSVTSLGYQCSNCTDTWYGIPLLILVEFVPVTLFYLIILVFKVHLTSAPMVIYIFYSQLILYGITNNSVYQQLLRNVRSQGETDPGFKSILFTYGIWNFDLVQYTAPPFCVSSRFQLTLVHLLGYIPILFPIFLIFMTWIFVQLHDCNFKLFVYLWRPFNKCLFRLQKGLDVSSSLIDVFASFFLLCYCKFMYQTLLFFKCTHLEHIHGASTQSKSVMVLDLEVTCAKGMHLAYIIPLGIFYFVFLFLPALLIVFYPIRIIRSKCRLNTIRINTFVEKFYSCYRDGLDGGRDMRSFSGLYFFMIFFVTGLLHYASFVDKRLSLFRLAAFVFLAFALLITFVKPYKCTYRNLLDGLLLAHMTVLFTLLAREYDPRNEVQVMVIILLPAVVFGLIIIFKILCKFKNSVKVCKEHLARKLNRKNAEYSRQVDSRETEPLIAPTSSTVDLTPCAADT